MTLSTRDRAIIALRKTGQSYSRVARKMGLGTDTVMTVLHREAPDLIWGNNERRKESEEGLTLTALGLYRVGPCTSCECEIVSYTRDKGQVCGLCEAAA